MPRGTLRFLLLASPGAAREFHHFMVLVFSWA